MRLLWAILPALVQDALSVALPFPGFLFYPKDAVVGDVERVAPDELASRLSGTSALVVGGTDGIGRGTALAMAQAGASVSVVGHSRHKADWMLGNLTRAARDPSSQRFHAYAQDLLTVRGCLNFTSLLRLQGHRFDHAILTVGMWPDRESPKSGDGVDKVIALDVLARYLITREVLPLLNPGARVLSVLGSTMRLPPAPPLDVIKGIALGAKSDYSLAQMLGAAGAMGDAWMQALPRRRQVADAHFLGTFPGVVASDLVARSGTFPGWLAPLLEAGERLVAMSQEEAGRIHATIVSSPNAARRPTAYFNFKFEGRRAGALAYDADFGEWVCSFLERTIRAHGKPALRTAFV